LAFIEQEYVEVDDDASHHTWSDILTATRQAKMTLYAWVDSFTLLGLRYKETVTKMPTGRRVKINKIIGKQITEDEKLLIATLNAPYSSIVMSEGRYVLTDLIKLLAQNVTSFTKKYLPTEHPRIEKYLHTRSLKYKHIAPVATQKIKGKGKGPPLKKLKAHSNTQRAWTYVQEPITSTLSAPAPYSKGKPNTKGKGKFSSKGKGLGKGKSVPFSKGKGKKGKGKGKNGQRSPKGSPGINSGLPESSSRPEIKCHFCHIVGHIKPKCRKWLALSESERYQQKNSHDTKYQLIYDHLEDSVLAPTGFCQYCSDSNCDGQNCSIIMTISRPLYFSPSR
jgi:hypothetical protein